MAGRIVAVLFASAFALLGAVALFRAKALQRWETARYEKHPTYGIPILDRWFSRYIRSPWYVWQTRFLGGLLF